jgi:ribose-phosphate pyrophosphokinase
VSRFSDGEVDCDIKDSVRGKHVFILQSCSAPVNDNIMEILLMISCAKRAGADRITAVIPYFGYKYHKRGHAISTKHSSRFLWSVSADFAKMLEVMGVDRVISVDLQRPGEGQETCFFSNKIPVESVSSVELMADYVAANIPLGKNVVIVASNSDCIKKARKFQQGLKSKVDTIESIGLAAFLHSYGAEKHHNSTASLLGHSDVRGADVIILDEVVETASTMSILCRRLINQGAKRVYLVATHGLFTENSMERIHASPVDKVIVTDSVQLPEFVSSKVVQVSMARSLAKVIDTEFHSSEANRLEDEDDYVID